MEYEMKKMKIIMVVIFFRSEFETICQSWSPSNRASPGVAGVQEFTSVTDS